MNPLLKSGAIEEMRSGTNFSYIFRDNDDFASTQYKVLRNQTTVHLLPCVCAHYNGQIELNYLTGERKPFSTLFPSLDAYAFRSAVAGILAAAIQVKNIGFLSCENIDISFDKIFIDTATFQAALVYIPSKKTLYQDVSDFENELRSELVRLISDVTVFLTPKTMALAADLSNGKLSLEEVLEHIIAMRDFENGAMLDPGPAKGDPSEDDKQKASESPSGEKSGMLALRHSDDKNTIEIRINKVPFIIGKSSEADGTIASNEFISKRHCRVTSRNGRYYLADLSSVNHSYINGKILEPEREYPLKEGDVVRLANADFQVYIR